MKKREKRNKKEAGTTFRSLLNFLQIKSAAQGRRRCRKPEEREETETEKGERSLSLDTRGEKAEPLSISS
jgi:hypothetical protein